MEQWTMSRSWPSVRAISAQRTDQSSQLGLSRRGMEKVAGPPFCAST